HFLQALDGALDRLEVGHHAAQPTAVDVRHAATCGFLSHDFTRCTLGAHEQHLAATGGQLTQVLLGLQELDNTVFQIDDMNLVTVTEDERSHLGVPVTGLVAKVHTSFQHFTHQRHGKVSPRVGSNAWCK